MSAGASSVADAWHKRDRRPRRQRRPPTPVRDGAAWSVEHVPGRAPSAQRNAGQVRSGLKCLLSGGCANNVTCLAGYNILTALGLAVRVCGRGGAPEVRESQPAGWRPKEERRGNERPGRAHPSWALGWAGSACPGPGPIGVIRNKLTRIHWKNKGA